MDDYPRRLLLAFITITILQYYQQQYVIEMYKQSTAVAIYTPVFRSNMTIIQKNTCLKSEKPVEFDCKWQYSCVPSINQIYRRP